MFSVALDFGQSRNLRSDWQFNLQWLSREARVGRDKARKIVDELTERGYCQRSQ
jgi:hypothetical protein